MTDAETTVTLPPEQRAASRPRVAVAEPEEPQEARDWFSGAVPGARPAFRTKGKIGMG